MRKTDKAYEFIMNRFFCDKTCLIYDFLINDTDNAYDYLPTPEQVKEQYPNPCGWGTGMEDSVLNGGSLIDALVAKYEATGDKTIKFATDRLLRGLLCCAFADGDSGFVARSVLPADGSYYINSSRDQYTHFVYAALRLYNSALADDEQKRDIARAVCNVANRCMRDVTPENDYNLLRADGKIGMVCKMWGALGAHEYLRLPMFYLAAYHVSGDEKYRREYDKYIDKAVDHSLGFVFDDSRIYISLQLQYSLRLIYDLCDDAPLRRRLYPLMRALAENGLAYIKNHADKLNDFGFVYLPFDKAPMSDNGVFGGRRYLNPAQNEDTDNNPTFYSVRGVGEALCLAALCPDFAIDEQYINSVEALADKIDYNHHYTYAPLLLFCGVWLARGENNKYNTTDRNAGE